ncbi:hypothetical protein AB1Y20_019036 [Prymnesium parvum]|uniref:Major facilitator superfamily (MFS) profile domain-containing protein n=1 Tax=Prymnesium parvum TaxID=97485 RepID=A0AB34JT67_PRYPA
MHYSPALSPSPLLVSRRGSADGGGRRSHRTPEHTEPLHAPRGAIDPVPFLALPPSQLPLASGPAAHAGADIRLYASAGREHARSAPSCSPEPLTGSEASSGAEAREYNLTSISDEGRSFTFVPISSRGASGSFDVPFEPATRARSRTVIPVVGVASPAASCSSDGGVLAAVAAGEFGEGGQASRREALVLPPPVWLGGANAPRDRRFGVALRLTCVISLSCFSSGCCFVYGRPFSALEPSLLAHGLAPTHLYSPVALPRLAAPSFPPPLPLPPLSPLARHDDSLAASPPPIHVTIITLGLSKESLMYRNYVAACGALACVYPLSRYGRRCSLMLAGGCFLIASVARVIVLCLLSDPGTFEASPRLLASSACDWWAQGMVSATVPLYIAEISPAAQRGTLIAISFVSFWLGLNLASLCIHYVDPLVAQGPAILSAVVCAVAFFQLLLLFQNYDSPRSALARGKLDEARASLRVLHGGVHADEEALEADLEYMSSVVEEDRCIATPFHSLSRAWRPLLLGVGLQLLSPLSTGMYVLGLQQPLFGADSPANAYEIAYATLAAAVVSVFVIDRIGRRRFLVYSCVILALSGTGMATSFEYGSPWLLKRTEYFLYCAGSFAGLTLLPQVATVEIFTSGSAASGVGISMAAFWLGSTGAFYLFDFIKQELPDATVWVHIGSSIVECVYMLCLSIVSPETAKRPLDTHLYGWMSNTARPIIARETRSGRSRSISVLLSGLGIRTSTTTDYAERQDDRR